MVKCLVARSLLCLNKYLRLYYHDAVPEYISKVPDNRC